MWQKASTGAYFIVKGNKHGTPPDKESIMDHYGDKWEDSLTRWLAQHGRPSSGMDEVQ